MRIARLAACGTLGVLAAGGILWACSSDSPPSNGSDAAAPSAEAGSPSDAPVSGDDSGGTGGFLDGARPSDDATPGEAGDAGGDLEAITPISNCTLPVGDGGFSAAANVAYAVDGGGSQTLDVGFPYPIVAGKPHPIVLFVHGGGWIQGDKSAHDGEAVYLAELGYVAATANYRLVDDAGANRFPTAIADVRCALRWLRKNAATYGADPARVALIGDSAGGHLVTLLATTPTETSFDGVCPELGSDPADIAVTAVVDFYGPTDLRHSSDYPASIAGVIAELLGATPESVPTVAALASPITHISASTPPHLILQGTADIYVPPAVSEAYYAALRQARVPSTLVLLQGVGHAFGDLGDLPIVRPATCTTLAFLKDRLKP